MDCSSIAACFLHFCSCCHGPSQLKNRQYYQLVLPTYPTRPGWQAAAATWLQHESARDLHQAFMRPGALWLLVGIKPSLLSLPPLSLSFYSIPLGNLPLALSVIYGFVLCCVGYTCFLIPLTVLLGVAMLFA